MLRRDETTPVFRPPSAGLASLALLVALQAVGQFSLPAVAAIAVIVLAFGAGARAQPLPLVLRAGVASLAVFFLAGWARASAAATGQALSLAPSVRILGGLAWATGAGMLAVVLDGRPAKARLAQARARLAGFLPRPDPDFDPFTAAHGAAPPVREMVLHVGPTPGSGRRPVFGEPVELAWG